MTPGQKFREAVVKHKPLQIPGVINAYNAMMATELGFQALYLSGGGVANNSCGLPELGIKRCIKSMIKAGVAAVHIEDQVDQKRCGHLDGKQLISQQEMVDRLKACIDARTDSSFVIMARTDAFAVEGLEATFERLAAYEAAGADMLFLEALPELKLYQQFAEKTQLPLLANMTEFGKTPLFTASQLAEVGVSMVLYPRTIDRVMSQAAVDTMTIILNQGTQQSCVANMQTRAQLYDFLKNKTGYSG